MTLRRFILQTFKVYFIRVLLHGCGNDQIHSSLGSLRTWAESTGFSYQHVGFESIHGKFSKIQSLGSSMLVTQDHHANSDASTRHKMIIDDHRIAIHCRSTPHLTLLRSYRFNQCFTK